MRNQLARSIRFFRRHLTRSDFPSRRKFNLEAIYRAMLACHMTPADVKNL